VPPAAAAGVRKPVRRAKVPPAGGAGGLKTAFVHA